MAKSGMERPMRVLVVGIPQTGTSSLLAALEKLGYKTYHMHELVKNPSHFTWWSNAIKAKFNSQLQPLNPPKFQEVLSGYDVVSDVPAVLFVDELLAAYPDIKVILTTQDSQKWVASMQATIWYIHSWWTWDWIAPLSPGVVQGWRSCDTLVWDAFINSSIEKPGLLPPRRDYLTAEYRELAVKRFDDYNNYIRRAVSKDRLLEFQPQNGWVPLCGFLGHEAPLGEYSVDGDEDELLKYATIIWAVAILSAAMKLASPVFLAFGLRWLGKRYGWW